MISISEYCQTCKHNGELDKCYGCNVIFKMDRKLSNYESNTKEQEQEFITKKEMEL